MRYIITLTLVLILSVSINAQESFLHKKLDTIKASYRTGGEKLDSLDLIFSEKFITTPGSFYANPFGKFGNNYISFFESISKQNRDLKAIEYKYSAIPHLGAYYAFGSKGTQYFVFNYNQSFSKKTHLATQYKRHVASGAFRNNAFSNDEFSIGLLYKGKRLINDLSLSSFKQQRNLSGGIFSFDEIELYGIDYAKVKKNNSSDSISRFLIKTETEYGILKKDSLHKIAFILKNKLVIDKRVFREKDSLLKWYPNSIYIDSFNTRDLSQLSRLDVQSGIRYKNQNTRIELLIDKGYWKYKTLSHQYKNELDFIANLYFENNKWNVQLENQYNIVGANNQFKYSINLAKLGRKVDFLCNINKIGLLPTPMQRAYFTNTLNYNLTDLKLQNTQSAIITLKTKQKQSIILSAYYSNYKNHYFFIKNSWRNDTLNSINHFTLKASGDFSFGLLHIQPNISINLLDKVQLLPKYDLRSRFFISKIFKRPATVLNFGIDVNYNSTYQLMTFDDRIAIFKMNFNNGYFKDYLMLDGFTSLQIDELRMYFKIENLDSFWTNRINSIAMGYPIAPFIMRLGLTWDFFN